MNFLYNYFKSLFAHFGFWKPNNKVIAYESPDAQLLCSFKLTPLQAKRAKIFNDMQAKDFKETAQHYKNSQGGK